MFQPLLYQVATSELAPGQIGSPIRGILRNQKNTTVILGEVTGVDKEQKCVFVSDADRENVSIAYDYLILATGVSHSYFGHDEFEEFASGVEKPRRRRGDPKQAVAGVLNWPRLKKIPAVTVILLTFVLVGAGPTGVEMAGAIAVLVRSTLEIRISTNRSGLRTDCTCGHGRRGSCRPFSRTSLRLQATGLKDWALRFDSDTASTKSTRTESSWRESELPARL